MKYIALIQHNPAAWEALSQGERDAFNTDADAFLDTVTKSGELIEADEAQLRELAAMWANKELSSGEWKAAKQPIEKRMTVARKQLASASRSSALDQYRGQGEQLRTDWESLDLSQQHAIVSAVVDHVKVGPGRRGYNRFDESRLTAVWRP